MFLTFLVLLLLTSCGQVEPGDTDRALDCIDGCSPKVSPSPSPLPPKDGDSCTVAPSNNGAVITCGNSSVLILNGAKGNNGKDAPPTAFTVTEMIDPCGKQGQFDEILLRLHSGQIVAHFSNGQNQFLTFIGPGTYGTTDGTGCTFTVGQDMEVAW